MRLGVVILAAGVGKRMRSALPKVLHPLAGRPLLVHVLDAAARIGSAQTVVVYGHGGEQVLTALADRDCAWVEQPERLGTGHVVQQAMPLVGTMERILVLYGDVPLLDPETLGRLIEASRDCPLGILTAELPDPTGYGRIIRDPATGRILRSVEHRDATPEELGVRECNTGFLVADRARLQGWLGRLTNDNAQGEYYLTDVIAFAVADGDEVASVRAPTIEEVSGVNDRIQLAALERHYQRRQAEDLMRRGVTLADPARIDIRGTLETGQDVTIDVNLVVEGRVTLGQAARIGPNCLIRDSVIGEGAEILANCVIEGAEIGAGARVGPFARLRPEAQLDIDTHIGNFVEIKKSRIGPGSKVNHLTYVGDTEIGSGVN
ncbi:MAG: bifunctional UDP-N-acetylglucosamine diphosphorylase/glucosamine-1-phosphate N-acetyltransferase GlmU, partial [Bdellovibrio bacteriovorus]